MLLNERVSFMEFICKDGIKVIVDGSITLNYVIETNT